MGRDRRNGRANVKTRVGIATAVLVGGGAIGVAAVAASHGASPAAAQSAGYKSQVSHYHSTSEWSMLNSALSNSGSRMSTLASMTQQTFNETAQHGRTLAEQRGIVVLATSRFLIVQSANGSLHLWVLSGKTAIENVANSSSGTGALTGNASATTQAMRSGDMIPATTLLAGSPLTASHLLTPASVPETVTVQVAGTNLTVTVTVTKSTATVSSTATMPTSGSPVWSPSTMTQSAWATTGNSTLARGDLVLVVGSRSHNLLHAQVVLFTPLTTSVVGGNGSVPTTHTSTTTPHTTPNQPTGVSGTHY